MRNKKFYFIFSLILMFLLLSCTSCFAAYLPEDFNSLGDTNKYFLVFQDKNNDYFLVSTDSALSYENYGKDSNFWRADKKAKERKDIKIYKWINGEWVLQVANERYGTCGYLIINGYSIDGFVTMYETFLIVSEYGTSINLVASNYDVCHTQDMDTIFFPETPLGLVARQVEEVEMSQVMTEIILILPLILVVVVSLVGLRKGLKMLLTFLKAC